MLAITIPKMMRFVFVHNSIFTSYGHLQISNLYHAAVVKIVPIATHVEVDFMCVDMVRVNFPA